MAFWRALGANLAPQMAPTWGASWAEVGAKLAPKSEKKEPQEASIQMSKNVSIKTSCDEVNDHVQRPPQGGWGPT